MTTVLHWKVLHAVGVGIVVAWVLWFAVWVAASLRTKPVVHRETAGSRAYYASLIVASMILLLLAKSTRVGAAILASGPPASWLYLRFIPFYPGVVWVGGPLVLAGMVVAFWARFHLGANWSGAVTLKEDHELVRTGPYRLVRHPIYTGMLLAVAGTACAIGQVRGVLGFALAFYALWHKSRIEERLMIDTFGDAYRRYRTEVKGLIPYVL